MIAAAFLGLWRKADATHSKCACRESGVPVRVRATLPNGPVVKRRHAGLRNQCLRAWGCKSLQGYQFLGGMRHGAARWSVKPVAMSVVGSILHPADQLPLFHPEGKMNNMLASRDAGSTCAMGNGVVWGTSNGAILRGPAAGPCRIAPVECGRPRRRGEATDPNASSARCLHAGCRHGRGRETFPALFSTTCNTQQTER